MKIDIPSDIGELVDSIVFPESDKEVFVVDSGMFESYDKEKAVSFAIEYLLFKYKTDTIMIPKRSGYVNCGIMGCFPGHKIRDQGSDHMLKERKMDGAEQLVTHYIDEISFDLYGVEDSELFRKISEEQRAGKSIFKLMEQRQQSLVEKTLEYMKRGEKTRAVMVAKGFDIDGIKRHLSSKRVSHHIIEPSDSLPDETMEAHDRRKRKVIRATKTDVGYESPIMFLGERCAWDKMAEALGKKDDRPGFMGYLPTGVISKGCYKKVIKLEKEGTGAKLALKMVDIVNLSDRAEENLRRNGWENPVDAFEKEKERMKMIGDKSKYISFLVGGFQVSGFYFLIEEFSDDNIKDYVLKSNPLEKGEVARISSQLAEGLNAVHQEGLCHGDLHPDNILMYGIPGDIKITDFDLCSSLFGMDDNLRYLVPHSEIRAPELYEGGNLSLPTDVWAYGVDVFFMGTGKMPFPKSFHGTQDDYEDLTKEERAHLRTEIYNMIKDDSHYSGVIQEVGRVFDPNLASIVKKCLERDPKDRFQNAAELYEAVRSV